MGYGDMPISTSAEQYFGIMVMLGGVVLFSTVSGALASILSSFDQTNADLAVQVAFLNKLSQ